MRMGNKWEYRGTEASRKQAVAMPSPRPWRGTNSAGFKVTAPLSASAA
jgi:hypothetical protein